MKAKQTYADGEGDFGGLETIVGCDRWAAKRLLGVTDGQQDGWRGRDCRNKLLSFYQQPYYIMKICVSL